ncbi:hypothetical protein AND4_10714 [Vibrio sp. AND4]|nr:hypothetical protein AND4_10714 [Vibrio sp. AND4]
MIIQLHSLISDSSELNSSDKFCIYYREMIKVSQFKRSIAQLIHTPFSDTRRELFGKVSADISKPIPIVNFEKFIDGILFVED